MTPAQCEILDGLRARGSMFTATLFEQAWSSPKRTIRGGHSIGGQPVKKVLKRARQAAEAARQAELVLG